MALTKNDYRLIAEIQEGLPLSSHPYQEIGERIGMNEQEVIERVKAMQESGIIKRMGIVVHHRELGYKANAMVVWNVPDEHIDEVGGKLGAHGGVTLCYRRSRQLPEWPYNLYCMIHGQDRQRVLNRIDTIVQAHQLEDIPHKVLFSGRRFKQCGARYR